MTEDQYARRALSELVACVASKWAGPIEGLQYRTLAYRIGRRGPNGEGVGLGMGRILAKMGWMLQQLEADWGKHIPDIQCLVIDKAGRNRGLPADGIEEFWPNYRHLTRQQKEARVRREHNRILAFGRQWYQVLKRLGIRNVNAAIKQRWLGKKTCYWVVSPNVRYKESTVDAWRRASVRAQAAFMGWYPNDWDHGQMGPKFAGRTKRGIKPGDIIIIARRHHHEPEIIGFGVVRGEFAKRIVGLKTPESFGSLRRLRPFIPWTGSPPRDVPIMEAVRHIKALVQLHPDWYGAHGKVCDWLDEQLQNRRPSGGTGERTNKHQQSQKKSSPIPRIVSSPENHQLDYTFQTKAKIIRARKVEAQLLEGYRGWLERQDRKLFAVKYNFLQCDAYEEARRNLIEAKSSARRENIRMAVGQLLDYAYQGNRKFGNPHKAILLPREPSHEIVNWLDSLDIKVIWRDKKVFLDNANGRFT
jgi:hypothetical protein